MYKTSREVNFLNNIAVVRSVFLPISETFIYGEIRQMKRYEPYIFCEKKQNKDCFPHKNVIISPNYHKLESMLENNHIKLIHARFGTSGIRMLPLKEKWRVPLVTSFHGCDSPSTDKMKKRIKSLLRLFSIGECFTVPCQAMKDELIKYGCPANKVTVQYSGIDLNQFLYKERYFPSDGQVRIVYVGRLVEKKGAALLIRAFQQVNQIYPQAQLSIIGDGILAKKLKRLTKELKLQHHISFLGALPHHQVAKHLEQSHIFCLPSMKDRVGNIEGIPNAIKEAMACGLPVISTLHSGIPELIDNGQTGHLVAEKDSNELARKLIDLMKHPDTWRQLGLKARLKIETDFNREKQTEKLELLFDQVIKEHEQKQLEKPFFSVVIPTYNREKFIGRAIKSVLKQSCKDYELIVVDDGSTDKTSKVVKSFGKQVQYIRQKNKGPSEARNTGIQSARGKYIAFLDSDDRFLPNKLKENKNFLIQNQGSPFLYSWYYDVRPGRRRRLIRDLKSYPNLKKFRDHLFKRKITIRTSTVVIQEDCFDQTGLFNAKYRYSQDWDMWLRLACKYPGSCQKKPLSVYRRHHRKRIPGSKRHSIIRKAAKKLYKRSGTIDAN